MVPHDDVVEAVTLLLDQPDVCDLAIEDLRKWHCWGLTPRILGLRTKESHDIPIIRRALLRFALSSPSKEAKKYVETQRKEDEQTVTDAEELLKLEQQQTQSAAPAPSVTPSTKTK